MILKLESEFPPEQTFVTIDFNEIIKAEVIANPDIGREEFFHDYPAIDNLMDDNEFLPDEIITLKSYNTLLTNSEMVITKHDSSEFTAEQLKMARSILDSFLILHPEYRKHILTEHSKIIKENVPPFIKPGKRMNAYISKLLRETYPEGADYALYKNLNPGFNFPIDKLIDFVKGIIE